MPTPRTKRRHVYQDDIFAVYQDDELLVVGTRNECAKALGVKRTTITYYTTPSYKQRVKERGIAKPRTVIRLGRDPIQRKRKEHIHGR